MLTKIFEDRKVQKLASYLDRGDDFVVISHVSPDGDAIGSSLALYHYLIWLGKRATVIMPNEYPAFLRWLPESKGILLHERYPDFAEQLVRDADVIFCLDFNEPKRIGKLASSVEASKARKVMIDHHLDPAPFCKLTFSHPDLSSTAEMIFRMLCALKSADAIDATIGTCIYTGMMTDTGGFTYHSNDPDLYIIIRELVRTGIDKDLIYRRVFQVYSESRLRLMGYTLQEKMKVYPASKSALITLTLEEQNRFNYATGDTEGFVNLPLSIEWVEFVAFIREHTDCIKVSLRSTGDFPCNRFASEFFNGGGHKNASGGEFTGTLEAAVRIFEYGLLTLNPTKY